MSDALAVREVMARYVRAADRRDSDAMAALFTEDGRVEILYDKNGPEIMLGVLEGREAIAAAVRNMMAPHAPRAWSHHTTHDLIVEINGDRATLDAQFIVFSVQGEEKPVSGWPSGAQGAQGVITPIESGYYRPELKKSADGWRIARLRIHHDLPMAFAQAE
jgi:ketosteroid isomerase-like protein